MSLHRLLYRSQSAIEGLPGEVDARILSIIERARANNAAAGITGALLISSGVFIQALEGPTASVERAFERICRDQRHRQVRLIEFTPADARAFPEWSMASVAPEGELVRLCASLTAIEAARASTLNAAATIQLMRTLLLTSAPRLDAAGVPAQSGARPAAGG